MARYRITNARIVTSDQIVSGSLCVDGDKIAGIDVPFEADYTVDAGGCYVAPGFIDIHTHGAGGADFMDGTVDAYLTASKMQAAHGATLVYPTTLTSTNELLYESFETFRKAVSANKEGAQFGGMHLEGPYFSAEQAGAQDPRYLKNPDEKEYLRFLEETDDILRWSAAPELPGALEFGRNMAKSGVLPSIAHSNAIYDEVLAAFDAGYTMVTHLYSGMSTIKRVNSYRFPGVLESAYLIDGMNVEIIADGRHLPASLLQYVVKFKPTDKIALCTDSMRGAGAKDGEYTILGSLKKGQKVIVEDQVAKLLDRSCFAGSVATSDRLVRTMITMAGCSVVQAVRMASALTASSTSTSRSSSARKRSSKRATMPTLSSLTKTSR